MKKHTTYALLLAVVFTGGLFSSLVRVKTSQDPARELLALKMVLPGAESFSEKSGTPPYYMAYKTNPATGAKDLIGYAFLTTDIAPEVRGYAGPIKAMVGMDLKGSITGMYVISHSETPSYVMTLDEFIRQFVSKDTTHPFQLGRDIDGMTRATISSEAIARSAEKSLKAMAAALLNIPSTNYVPAPKPFPVSQILLPLGIFALAIAGLLRNNTLLRWLSLLGGLAYLGFIKSTMVSVVQVANIGLLKVPSFSSNPLWYCLLVLTFVTSLSLGMVYCGSVCPFGAVQEILYAAFKKLGPKKIPLSPILDRRAKHIKYILLLCVLTVSFLLGNAGPAAIEPFLTFFTAHATAIGWTFLVMVLAVSIFDFRFWCKYLCPIGALTGLFARASFLKINLGENCTGCEICERTCPTRAITMTNKKPVIDYAECILCGKCIQKCPRTSLTIRAKPDVRTG